MPSKADLHRKGYEAFGTGDLEALSEIIAEDTVWHNAGDSPVSGDHQGRDAVFAMFGKLNELTGGQFSLDVHDVLESDDHTVGLLRASGTRDGKTFEGNAIEVCHWRDGQVVEEWFTFYDQEAADAFFA